MNRFTRFAVALAVLAAAGTASAFTRETTTRGHPESGLWLWWNSRQVTYRVNASAVTRTGCATPATAEATIAAALSSWTTTCTDFTFLRGAASTSIALGNDGTNLVVLRNKRCVDVFTGSNCSLNVPGDCASKLNCWEYDIGTIALTTTSFDTATGEIHDADMELFAWDGGSPPVGQYFTCGIPTDARCPSDPRTPGASPPAGCNWTDLQAVATHEAGHMLGLDHVCSNEGGASSPFVACPAGRTPVMAPDVGDVALRDLTADDSSGVCTIYPKGADTLKSPGVGSPSKSGGGGCSTGGGAGLLALLGAAAASWRARRRD